MTVTIPVLGVVILIFILHTIITHLINWAYRKAWAQDAMEEVGLMLILTLFNIIEVAACIAVLKYYLT